VVPSDKQEIKILDHEDHEEHEEKTIKKPITFCFYYGFFVLFVYFVVKD
jgi:hypothetical protein